MSSISGLGMSNAEFAMAYATSVTKKAMDTTEIAAEGLQKMLSSVPVPAKGQYIDVYA